MLDSHADFLANVPHAIRCDGGQIVPTSKRKDFDGVGVIAHVTENKGSAAPPPDVQYGGACAAGIAETCG